MDFYCNVTIITNANPLTFDVGNVESYFGKGEAATFDPATGSLHIPYLDLGTQYSFEFDLLLSVEPQGLVASEVVFAENRPATDPRLDNVRPISSTDLWDASNGVEITGSSGELENCSAINLFQEDVTVFEDQQPAGAEHWVEWTTPTEVTVKSFNIVAHHDATVDGSDGNINQRGFSAFRLFYGNGDGKWTQFFEYSADPDKDLLYGGGPFHPESNFLELAFFIDPVTARHFRAVFVQYGDGLGPRIDELDAYSPED